MSSQLPTGPTPSALAMQSKFAAAARDESNPPNPIRFRPNWLFLYGTLMDPEILQSILSMRDLPTLYDAVVTGFQLRMWGIYPTLVRNSDHRSGKVKGKVFWLESWEDMQKLQAYETHAYRWGLCDIVLKDDVEVENARVFEWAASPDSCELHDGFFDLGHFQKHFKPSILGKPAV